METISIINGYRIPTIWEGEQTTFIIGKYTVLWDCSTRCITSVKDGKLIEKYRYPEDYTIGQFHKFITLLIEAAKQDEQDYEI